MNILVKSIFIGLAAAVVSLLLLKIMPEKKKQFYRVHAIVNIAKEKGSSAGMEEIMDQTLPIIEQRIDQLGYGTSINRKDLNHIDIVINHATDTLLTRQAIEANIKLEFRELYMLSELFTSFNSMSEAAKKYFPEVTGADSKAFNNKNISSLIFFSISSEGRPIDNGTIGRAFKKDTAMINKIFSDTGVLRSFPLDVQFCYGPLESSASARDKQILLNIYAIKTMMHEAPLQNKDIVHAEAGKVFNINKEPQLLLQFSKMGSHIWERMTMENKGRNIAIIIDKKVISAPHVNEAIFGGNTSISGGLKPDELESIAQQLNAGYVPADLSIVEQDITVEKPSFVAKNLLIPAMIFLVTAGLAFFILYRLKRT